MTRHQLAKSFLKQNKEHVARFVLAVSEDTISNSCCGCQHDNPNCWHHNGEAIDLCYNVKAEVKHLLEQNDEPRARKLLEAFK